MPLQQSQLTNPEGLEAYFTDVEHLREAFRALIAAPALPRRLLVVHGVGGVGKSSLLRMFCLHCKSVRVPVAIASSSPIPKASRCWRPSAWRGSGSRGMGERKRWWWSGLKRYSDEIDSFLTTCSSPDASTWGNRSGSY